MPPIVIYTPKSSNRLRYVLDHIFNERLQTGYRLVHSAAEAENNSCIVYGTTSGNCLSVPDEGLLWETGIQQQEIKTGVWQEVPTLYDAEGPANLPFDIFSAVFFLLSRYEEYYSYTPDKHGRYPATDSILYKHSWLQRPLVDEWIALLKTELANRFNIQSADAAFSFLPTYDIDIAYSYKLKGFKRTAGAALKSIASGKLATLNERFSVLGNKAKDPYDSYDFLHQLHTSLQYRPIYFILAALQTTAFDKNISPLNMGMQMLIGKLGEEGTIAIHPSYYSDTQVQKLDEEKNVLEKLSGTTITQSRQHYIKLKMPDTYRRLTEYGIAEDYSMGYATQLGFRAGSGSSFQWYDLQYESPTGLRVHPFCFMDTTAHFDCGLSVEEAFSRLELMANILKRTGSTLITIFHNFSLGTDKEWNGWSQAYAAFLEQQAGS